MENKWLKQQLRKYSGGEFEIESSIKSVKTQGLPPLNDSNLINNVDIAFNDTNSFSNRNVIVNRSLQNSNNNKINNIPQNFNISLPTNSNNNLSNMSNISNINNGNNNING